jgi:hypothetical protein
MPGLPAPSCRTRPPKTLEIHPDTLVLSVKKWTPRNTEQDFDGECQLDIVEDGTERQGKKKEKQPRRRGRFCWGEGRLS